MRVPAGSCHLEMPFTETHLHLHLSIYSPESCTYTFSWKSSCGTSTHFICNVIVITASYIRQHSGKATAVCVVTTRIAGLQIMGCIGIYHLCGKEAAGRERETMAANSFRSQGTALHPSSWSPLIFVRQGTQNHLFCPSKAVCCMSSQSLWKLGLERIIQRAKTWPSWQNALSLISLSCSVLNWKMTCWPGLGHGVSCLHSLTEPVICCIHNVRENPCGVRSPWIEMTISSS